MCKYHLERTEAAQAASEGFAGVRHQCQQHWHSSAGGRNVVKVCCGTDPSPPHGACLAHRAMRGPRWVSRAGGYQRPPFPFHVSLSDCFMLLRTSVLLTDTLWAWTAQYKWEVVTNSCKYIFRFSTLTRKKKKKSRTFSCQCKNISHWGRFEVHKRKVTFLLLIYQNILLSCKFSFGFKPLLLPLSMCFTDTARKHQPYVFQALNFTFQL